MGNTERHDEPHNGGSCCIPYAQFQACVITGKAKVEWLPYNSDLYSLVIPSSPTS